MHTFGGAWFLMWFLVLGRRICVDVENGFGYMRGVRLS